MKQSLKVVLFERWPHACAKALLAKSPGLEVDVVQLKQTPAQIDAAFANAHLYQMRSTRSELPSLYWASDALFEKFPNLLAVSTNGSGYDTVDVEACTKAGVLAVNQAGGNKQAVAEHALAMMLSLSKRIVDADKAMRSVTDLKREAYMGHNLFGKTLGVVGLGAVGSHMARVAQGALGMKVVAFDPYIEADAFSACGAAAVSFDQLLSQSDVVSVHCPRNASSEKMFNAAAFAAMQPSAYFVTTARGGIHDEVALAAALSNGELAGAGLDVWEHEPPDPAHPLLQFDNVMASPHIAGVTHESREEVVRITIEQLNLIAQGRKPPRLLNPTVWPHFCERFTHIIGRTPEH